MRSSKAKDPVSGDHQQESLFNGAEHQVVFHGVDYFSDADEQDLTPMTATIVTYSFGGGKSREGCIWDPKAYKMKKRAAFCENM